MMNYRRRVAEQLGMVEAKAAAGEFFADAKSMLFDGVDERILVAHNASLNLERTDAFSFSFWMKFLDDGVFRVLLAKQYDAVPFRGYAVYRAATGEIIVQLINDTATTNRLAVSSTTGFTVSGAWYHVAVTYDGSSTAAGLKVYKNGVLETPIVLYDSLSATMQTTNDLYIARREIVDTPGFFYGNINELALYNKALTVGEVVSIYNAGKPYDLTAHGPTGNLISWWRMGEGVTAFPAIPDVKGVNDGTAVNMESGDIVSDVP
jgi:hypothetical protein